MYEEWIGKKAKLQVCLMYRDLSRKFGWWKLWEPGQEVWNKENVTIILDMVRLYSSGNKFVVFFWVAATLQNTTNLFPLLYY